MVPGRPTWYLFSTCSFEVQRELRWYHKLAGEPVLLSVDVCEAVYSGDPPVMVVAAVLVIRAITARETGNDTEALKVRPSKNKKTLPAISFCK